jgi:hypothetical protein
MDPAAGLELSLGFGGSALCSSATLPSLLSESALVNMATGGEMVRGIGAGVVGIDTSELTITPSPCCAIESK